jgi:hypothetical protein
MILLPNDMIEGENLPMSEFMMKNVHTNLDWSSVASDNNMIGIARFWNWIFLFEENNVIQEFILLSWWMWKGIHIPRIDRLRQPPTWSMRSDNAVGDERPIVCPMINEKKRNFDFWFRWVFDRFPRILFSRKIKISEDKNPKSIAFQLSLTMFKKWFQLKIVLGILIGSWKFDLFKNFHILLIFIFTTWFPKKDYHSHKLNYYWFLVVDQ